MNRSTSHLFWLLPLGVVACLLAMIYLPHGLYMPLRWLFSSGGRPTDFQVFVMATTRLLLPCLMVAIPVIVIAIWLRRRAGGAFLPARLPRCDGTARIAEVLLLAGMGIPLLVVIATGSSNHGMLLRLDRLTPSAAKVHVAVAAVACLCALVSLIVAARGRGSTATLLMAGTLSAYGLMLNGPGNPIETLAPSKKARTAPTGTLTINVSHCNVPGADLWVNGVYLGKLPCEIPLAEFFAKVPAWTEATRESLRDSGKRLGKYRQAMEAPESETDEWMRMTVPDINRDALSRSATYIHGKYYARVRYAGEWALAQGGAHASGGSDECYTSVEVRFERREKRLARLFDRARMQGYRVGPEWFETIGTYGHDGWLGLRKESLIDPAILGVLDDWARWRYRLNDARDSDRAWRVFRSICDEADSRQMYVTADVAGRTVDLLVPVLPPNALINYAEELLSNYGSIAFSQGELFGEFVFGSIERPAVFNWPVTGTFSFGGIGAGSQTLPVHGLAVAHAVWRLDQLLDARQSPSPNIVEERIAPALIRGNRRWELPTRVAAELGGPAVETFLLRHDWRAPVGIGTGSSWDDRVSINTHDVNRWLYLLAHLRSPTGDAFRAANAHEVMILAELMANSETDLEPPTFLFYDPQNGQRSLAAQFWPKYKSIAVSRSSSRVDDALACQFGYLVRMDPVSTPEMYVECWRAFRGESYETQKAISKLKPLPPDQRRAVLDALREEVGRDISNFSRDRDNEADDQRRKRVLAYLQIRDEPRADDKTIQEMIADLSSGDLEKKRQEMSAWLENVCPSHSVVPALAASSDPALRLVCMGALRSHPTPAHRALLESLLKDSDPAVRAAAENVRKDLARLASTPLSELASDFTATRPS